MNGSHVKQESEEYQIDNLDHIYKKWKPSEELYSRLKNDRAMNKDI